MFICVSVCEYLAQFTDHSYKRVLVCWLQLFFAEDKQNFENKWLSPRSGNPLQILPRNDDAPGISSDTSIFHRLFGGLLFPGSRKD